MSEKVTETNQSTGKEKYEINYDNTPFNVLYGEDYQVYNVHTVKRWLKDHDTYNKEIRGLSNFLYNSNGTYTNVIDYMVALPALDRIIYSNDTKHGRYKKNKKKFIDALNKIREKTTIRDALYKGAIDGIAFYYFDSNKPKSIPKYLSDYEIDEMYEVNDGHFNCSVLPLPTDYCRILGTVNMSPQIAFDCSYFDKFLSRGQSKRLRRYPKEIRSAYKEYRKDYNKKWVVLDNDKTITLKTRAKLEDRWGRPLGLAGFIDMLYEEYFVESKRSVLDEVNSTIVYQTFPEGKEKGTSSLTQKQQKSQHNNIKQALFSKGLQKGINFFSVASGSKIDKLTTNIDLLKINDDGELLNRISTSLGFAGSMLNGDSGGGIASQKSNMELVSAELFSWIEQIQDELNKVINKNVIQDDDVYIESYYLPITHANRKEMIGYFKELFTHGGGSRQAWVSSVGVNSDAYFSLLDEEVEQDFDKKYPPHQTAFTQSGNESDDTKQVDNDTDNDNTIKNKNNGANPID